MGRKKQVETWESLPDDLKSLQKKGRRIRFNGFWLYEDDRDRTIARWIEDQKQAGNDVSSMVKELIYNEATETRPTDTEIMARLDEIRDMLRRGSFVQSGAGNLPKAEDVDDLYNSLRGMGT